MWGFSSRACMYKEKFFLLEGQLYKERLVFNCFKNIKNVPRKQGECLFSKEKPKSFQGPKAGPGPQPIKAHFIRMTPLHSVSDFVPQKYVGPPDLNPGSTTACINMHSDHAGNSDDMGNHAKITNACACIDPLVSTQMLLDQQIQVQPLPNAVPVRRTT